MAFKKKRKEDDLELYPEEKFSDLFFTADKIKRKKGDSFSRELRRVKRERREETSGIADKLFSLFHITRKSRPRKKTAREKDARHAQSVRRRVLKKERVLSAAQPQKTGEVIRKSTEGKRKNPFTEKNFFVTVGLSCAAVVIVSAIAIPVSFAQPTAAVTLYDNGRELKATTDAATVGEFLEDNQIMLGEEDVIECGLADPIEDGKEIIIRRAIPLTVRSGGEDITVTMLAGTVGEALERAGVVLGEDDEVYPSEDSFISPGMTIDHIVVTYDTRVEEVPIAFENVTREDPDLPKGEKEIVQDGEEGVLQITYRQLYKNGVLVDEDDISRDVLQEPVDQVMAIGTYVEPEPEPEVQSQSSSSNKSGGSSGSGGSSSNKGGGSSGGSSGGGSSGGSSGGGSSDPDLGGKKGMKMQLTAYCSFCNSGNSTASGIYPSAGRTVACNSLPLGTRIYIEGIGERIVEDTGGMGGGVIDVYLGEQPDDSACSSFGRRSGVTVYIIG